MGTGDPQDLHRLEARFAEELGHPLGAAHHLSGVEPCRRNGGDSSQIDQVRERPLEAAFKCSEDAVGSGHASAHGSR